jgi:CubicO group peptidase (beta-lactamase class C family)
MSAKNSFAHLFYSVLTLAVLISAPANTSAQEITQPTTADLEAFVDPLMAEQMEKHKATGVVIAVVKDGEIQLAKGYGWADAAAKTPMTGDATLVRPGSISKLFTGIAVMQLVEEGKLDLDRDVNAYIDFAIPMPPGGVPVTLRRLMTHRAGFEEQVKDLIGAGPQAPALGERLKSQIPRRLFPGGDISAYSNYGAALAGYVVERVSGEKFEDYVTRRIMTPLGMARSTFAQPPPPDLIAMTARGHRDAATPYDFFEMIPLPPAGALSATAQDMGRFMIALLQAQGGAELPGDLAGPMRAMLAPQLSVGSGRMGYFAYETNVNHRTFMSHNGGTIAFSSVLLLHPESNTGLFMSTNCLVGARAMGPVIEKVVERYVPADETPASDAGAPAAAEVAGVYQTTRRSDASFMRFMALAGQIRFNPNAEGGIRGSDVFGIRTFIPDLKQIAPYAYQGPKGGKISFQRDELSGQWLANLGGPIQTMERVKWTEDARLVAPPLNVALLTLILTLLGWPMAAAWRRYKGRAFGATPPDRRDHLLARAVLLAYAAAVGAWIAFVGPAAGNDISVFSAANDGKLIMAYAVSWLAVVLTPLALWTAVRFWRDGVGGRWTRIHHSLLAFSALALAYVFVAYGLAGTTLNY